MTDFLILTNTPAGMKLALPKSQVESITDNNSQRHIKMTSGVGYNVVESFNEIISKFDEKKPNTRNSK